MSGWEQLSKTLVHFYDLILTDFHFRKVVQARSRAGVWPGLFAYTVSTVFKVVRFAGEQDTVLPVSSPLFLHPQRLCAFQSCAGHAVCMCRSLSQSPLCM